MWLLGIEHRPMERLFTPQTLADYLGLAVQTIYNRHASGGDLPPVIKIGRLLRFQPQDVVAWLERQRGQGQAEQSALVAAPRRRGRPSKAEEVAARNRAGRNAS